MEMVRELEMEPSSPHIPTIALKLHSVRGKLQNALPLELMPTEQLDDGVGQGIFPLLESIGSRSTKFPEHDSLGTELSKLLRQVNLTKYGKPGRMQSLIQSANFPLTLTGTINFEWPEFASSSAHEERSNGMSSLLIT